MSFGRTELKPEGCRSSLVLNCRNEDRIQSSSYRPQLEPVSFFWLLDSRSELVGPREVKLTLGVAFSLGNETSNKEQLTGVNLLTILVEEHLQEYNVVGILCLVYNNNINSFCTSFESQTSGAASPCRTSTSTFSERIRSM